MQLKPIVIGLAMSLAALSANATVTLTGKTLTQDEAWRVAEGEEVAIAPEAMKQVTDSNRLVMTAARQGVEIYGLTVGVGLNKDHKLFEASGEMTETARRASIDFNRNILRSHSVGYGAHLPKETARLAMVVRLNTLLTGRSGAQPYVAELYRDFLNKGITPVIPTRGSIGDADITLASHVGSVMMGEWRAEVDGKVVSGAEALRMKGIRPLVPEGKDGLAILSTNSVGIAMTMSAMREMRRVLQLSPVVYGLTLEGMNGNVAPFLAQTVKSHPLAGLSEAATEMRATLKGSYLWEKDPTRALQDPLSFRTTVYTISEAKRALNDLDELVNVQINSSDDNPGVILNASKEDLESSQVAQYFVKGEGLEGAIIPSANFEPLPIAIAAERAAIALGHVAHNSLHRTLRLDEDRFSGLSRYLAGPNNTAGHSFGATEDSMVSIYAENVDLANPVSLASTPVEGNIEDSASNLPRVANRLERSASNLIDLYAMEMLHNTQAIDLRKMKRSDVKLSEKTQALYDAYRKVVPFVEKDRIFSEDLEAGVKLLKSYEVK
ncbi:HAL/PAL/TAL family ammonia-lyase [Sutterella megalosphaeroides]|uniref:Histidine ammonia-lyase n=1 Tax=Sutterella megalosphaeroides TaxID=2494234 RepID=A0A2Z6I9N0_9BURK|nr:aromatic amino acid ammonia-lyase [Sutterella megalosphaeroides]BBF23165.1 histidine ammonia-lyase [Sutterella megalosphaeroides]